MGIQVSQLPARTVTTNRTLLAVHRARQQGILAIVFAVLAGFILLRGGGLPGRDPQGVAVGLVMLLLAVWEVARGKATLLFRSVKKTEAPRRFWFAVSLTALLGVILVALNFT